MYEIEYTPTRFVYKTSEGYPLTLKLFAFSVDGRKEEPLTLDGNKCHSSLIKVSVSAKGFGVGKRYLFIYIDLIRQTHSITIKSLEDFYEVGDKPKGRLCVKGRVLTNDEVKELIGGERYKMYRNGLLAFPKDAIRSALSMKMLPVKGMRKLAI